MKRSIFLSLLGLIALIFFTEKQNIEKAVIPPNDSKNQKELLVFHAEWCGACKEYEKTLKEAENQGIKIRRINIDKHPELARKYNVKRLPTTIVMEDGEEQDREEGAIDMFALWTLLGDTLKWVIPRLLNIIFFV